MEFFPLFLIFIIISEINLQKWTVKTKFENSNEINSYNSLELSLGEFSKGILYCTCDFDSLNNLITEIDDYISSSSISEFLRSSLENLNDALSYAKKIILKDPCNQDEIDQIKINLNNAYQNLKLSKGKSFDIPKIEDINFDLERGFIHPGGLYIQEDFDRVKKKLEEGDEEIKQAYNILKNAAYSQPNAATYPSEKIVRGGSSGENYINAARGASIAFQNALRWKIEGNQDCAKHAVEVLMAWASTTKEVTGDSNLALATGLYGYEFAQAAEIMRDYDGWANEDFNLFKKWMLNVWYPFCIKFLRERNGTWENKSKWWDAPGHYWSNWGLCNVMAVISIGILCDDVFIYNQGMSFFKYDQVGTYENPRTSNPIQNNGLTEFLGNLVVTTNESDLETGAYGKLGQMNESGRDIGHACMALGLAIDIAHQGWQQGDDLFSYMDYRLAAGIEFVAGQTQLIENLPWTNYQYGTNGFYYTDPRAYIMSEPCLEKYIRPYWGIVIGIYEEIKGVEMPFSKMSYNDMGIDGGASGPTSGYYDHMGYSFLLNKRDGLAPTEKVPTELKGIIKYEGNLDNLIPSLDLEKSMGNIKENIIYHSELGGLINNYVINNNVGVPKHSTITLIPLIPKDEENTGDWTWNTGETTQNITIIVEKSFAYRVIYKNKNGIESKQLFIIAVQGDCETTEGIQSIYLNDDLIGNDKAQVISGSSLTLELKVLDSYGAILWSTGETTYSINIPCLNSTRNVTAIFTNICGKQIIYIYQLFVVFPSEEDYSLINLESTDFKIQKKNNEEVWEDSNDYVISTEILSINTKIERQKYFYLGVKCDYIPPDSNKDYIKLVPLNSDYFNECEITITLNRNRIKYNLNLSPNSFSINSYGVFSLTNIIYNVDKININFITKNEENNPVDYIIFDKFIINEFKSEEEFSPINVNIKTINNNNEKIFIEISNDNKCFEPENNQYEISIISIKEDEFDNNEAELEAKKTEQQIINKIEELKLDIVKNFEENSLYESPSYSIYFYNTSETSQFRALSSESESNVNLMNCENILKEKYNIPNNEVLNIIKVDIKRKDTNSLQVEYEIYSEDFKLLDLDYCKNEKIRITIPYSLKNINEMRKLSKELDIEEKYKLGMKFGYDIFNPNSSFYHDICTLFDSEFSTDLIIEDRKKYYYLSQMFCEDSCIYISFNISNNKVNCDCYKKIEPNYNSFSRNFAYNIPNKDFNKKITNVNFKVFHCLNKGFKKFTKKIGVWIILILFICFCVLSIFAFLSTYDKDIVNINEDFNDKNISEIDYINMSYEFALQNDKRSFFKIYLSILKYNNLISYIFLYKAEKNNYMRMMILIFFISLLFLFNLFFFSDNDFTHIYLNEDKYDFSNEYPMAFVTTLICMLINMIIRIFLFKENKENISTYKTIEFQSNNTKIHENKKEVSITLNVNKNKFNGQIIIFELINIVIIIIVFFYLVSFGGIFVNNQKYIIIRVIFSLVTGLIIPFILCLLYSFLRYFGLKRKIKIVYKVSKIIQNY